MIAVPCDESSALQRARYEKRAGASKKQAGGDCVSAVVMGDGVGVCVCVEWCGRRVCKGSLAVAQGESWVMLSTTRLSLF